MPPILTNHSKKSSNTTNNPYTEGAQLTFSQDVRYLEGIRADILEKLLNFASDIKQISEDSYQIILKKDFADNFYNKASELISKKFGKGVRALPDGISFKGGVARCALESCLQKTTLEQISFRDIDLCYLPFEEQSVIDEVSRTFMPEDFKYGYGAEELAPRFYDDGTDFYDGTERSFAKLEPDGLYQMSAIENYLRSRDFTINELLLSGNSLFVTTQCLEDTKDNILRISQFERSANKHSKLFWKALRLSIDNECTIIPSFDFYYTTPFHIMLQLDKAFEKSEQFADKFAKAVYYVLGKQVSGNNVAKKLLQEMCDNSDLIKNYTLIDNMVAFVAKKLYQQSGLYEASKYVAQIDAFWGNNDEPIIDLSDIINQDISDRFPAEFDKLNALEEKLSKKSYRSNKYCSRGHRRK